MSYTDYYTKQVLRHLNLAGPFKRLPPMFNQFNLSGLGELTQTGDPWSDFISMMQDFIEHPKEYSGAQDEGVQVEAQMLNILTQVRDSYYSCRAQIEAVKKLNLTYGNSLTDSLNQYQVKHDSIYNRYVALKSKNIVVIEDLQSLSNELQSLLTEINSLKNKITEQLKDPTSLQTIVKDNGLFDKASTLIKYFIYAIIAYGAIKVLPDLTGMVKGFQKKEPIKAKK